MQTIYRDDNMEKICKKYVEGLIVGDMPRQQRVQSWYAEHAKKTCKILWCNSPQWICSLCCKPCHQYAKYAQGALLMSESELELARAGGPARRRAARQPEAWPRAGLGPEAVMVLARRRWRRLGSGPGQWLMGSPPARRKSDPSPASLVCCRLELQPVISKHAFNSSYS